MAQPSVRASWARGLLNTASRFGDEGDGERLVGAVPEDCRKEIGRALSISWLSFETYFTLIESLRAELGPRLLETLFSDHVFKLREATLYKPLLRGIGVFGRGAESMLRLYARGYGLSFRNTGKMAVKPRPAGPGVIITLRSIPELCREVGYAHGHAGSIQGGFRLADSRAIVRMDLGRIHSGEFTFDVEEQVDADASDEELIGRRPPPSTATMFPVETIRTMALLEDERDPADAERASDGPASEERDESPTDRSPV